jgi:hypothetical protein
MKKESLFRFRLIMDCAVLIAMVLVSAPFLNSFAQNDNQGTITVVNQQDSATLPSMSTASSSNSTGTLGEDDTAGTLMIPTEDIDVYVQDLTGKGFSVDSTYNFNDIRACDEQTLLVWSTSGKNLIEIVPALQEITAQLPYS